MPEEILNQDEVSLNQGDTFDANLTEGSLEELKAQALKAFASADLNEILPEAGQPRDEKGRFIAKKEEDAAEEQTVETPEKEEEPEEYIFEQVVENANGTKQVFRGKGASETEALQDLVQKLTQAQTNATKKINEQESRLKTIVPKDDFKPKEYSKEEEFVISQEMMQNPTKAFQKMFKDMTGYEVTEFRSSVEAAKAYNQAQEESQATSNFIATHPDYETTPANGKKMVNWVRTQGDPRKSVQENLEAAYQDLKESGLLKLKDEAGSTEQPTTEEDTSRIAKPSNVGATQTPKAQPVPAKKASSITQKGRGIPAPAVDEGAKRAELAKNLSTEELRTLAYKHADQF